MKGEPSGWDMIFDHYTFNRELIPRLQRTQKKYKSLCNKKTNTPVENTANGTEQRDLRRSYKWQINILKTVQDLQ